MTQVSKLAIAGGLTLWAAGIVFGTRYSNQYSYTPGDTGAAVEHWPDDTLIRLGSNMPTVLIALHPQCPCSSASVEELRKAIARSGQHPRMYALVYQPAGKPADWADTSVVKAVRSIPGVQILIDRDGTEIKRFHARVSGEVFLYDAHGQLRFKGGVTASRGHAGESQSGHALTARLDHPELPLTETPVFGCSLVHSAELTEATE